MSKLLKLIDRRTAIIIGVGVLLSLLINTLFVSTATSRLEDKRAVQVTKSAEVETLQKRVTEIERDGTAGIDMLVSRLATMETVAPMKIDDITLSSHMAELGDSAGIQLTKFDKSTSKPGQIYSFHYQQYNFEVKGDSRAVEQFANNIQSWNRDILTLGSMKVVSEKRGTSDNPVSALEQVVTGTGTILVWYSEKRPIVSAQATGTPAEGGANEVAPTDPAANGAETPATAP